MKILIACECSGIIRDAFRKKGHDAWSCDIKPDEKNNTNYHIQDDVLKHLDEGWDMMIGHPVCTFMCRNRAQLNKKEKVKMNWIVLRLTLIESRCFQSMRSGE